MRGKQEILRGSDPIDFMLKCQLDFIFFFNRVLGYDVGTHHTEMARLVDFYRYTAFQAPRQHGKTTLILSYILWMVAFNKNKNILVVANSRDQAMKNLEMLKDMIQENEFLKELVPLNKKQSWSKSEINTKTKCKVSAKANTPNIRGGSYDFVFCDEGGQYEDKSNFYGVIIPTVQATKGKICVVGTPESKMDLLAELSSEDNDIFASVIYRAITDTGRPLWTHKYSIEELIQIRDELYVKMGKAWEWQREWMCNPLGEEESFIPYDKLTSAFMFDNDFINFPNKNKRYVIGADFAMSAEKSADFSVFTILEEQYDGTHNIVYMWRAKGKSFEEQIDKLINLYNTFMCWKAVVDESNFGVVFFQTFKNAGLNVEGYAFQGYGGRKRHDLLVNLKMMFESKNIKIPRKIDSTNTMNLTDLLISEVRNMRVDYSEKTQKTSYKSVAAHDDCVMSLALAAHAIRNCSGNVFMEFI